MPKPNWKQRLSYWFDNQLAKGPWVMIGWLALAAIGVVVVATAVAMVFNIAPKGSGPLEVFWDFLFQTLVPNPFDVTAPLPFLLVILMITLISLLMVSILIGLLTTGIEGRLEGLRRGRSKVLEKDHTLILGWSHQVFTIISELVIANENRKNGAVIVILADEDKLSMDHAIRTRVSRLKNTRVITRSGSPMDLDDLEIASPHTARSIIVLPPDEDHPDSYVIKTILAIIHNHNRRTEPYHIVTQIESQHTLEVVNMVSPKDDIHALLVGDQIARITAQASRQPGLSVVYTELLNFEGNEIYFAPQAELVGKTFADALLAYDTSAVIGLQLAGSEIRLNPDMATRIAPGDKIIAITEDDDTFKLAAGATISISSRAIQVSEPVQPPAAEKGLILGWNCKAPMIIRELDDYVSPGSELVVVAAEEVVEQEIGEEIQEGWKALKNQKVTLMLGDISDRKMLNKLDLATFQHIIVLSYENMDKQAADAGTMETLLHLRNMTEQKGCRVAIISEMLDLRNRRLAEIAKVDDFIVSDHLISLMLAQLSENGELYFIFNELFDSYGPELYFKPVCDYIDVSQPVSFYTVVEAARRRGETAVGYRLLREMSDAERSYGIYTNPKKSTPVAFSPEDKVIVLAERP